MGANIAIKNIPIINTAVLKKMALCHPEMNNKSLFSKFKRE
jgi:hypothetical protein